MRSFLRILSIILLVAWMGLIFFFSAQTADESSQTSGQVIEVLAQKFYPDYENLTLAKKEAVIADYQYLARKTTHICIYAALGFFAFLTFVSYVKLHFFTRIFWASTVCVIYAVSDEFHQRFVLGRSCELRDVLLDSAGVLAAILLCAAFVKIIAPLRQKTAYAGTGKKQLVRLNNKLYEKLDDTVHENGKLEKEIKEYKKKIDDLETELEQISLQSALTDDTSEVLIQDMENEIQLLQEENRKDIKLSEEMLYAASVIGDAVVRVTKLCNELTVGEPDSTRKELVNLALGKTEVLKSDIFKILSMEIPFEQKKNLIEKEKQDTYDYFDSIIAQIL